ncbi:MAG: hypothetical protein JST75_06640 [Bacteroidetes bacterium]|nr:hypothetical protein [Bacteroidota bacterium]
MDSMILLVATILMWVAAFAGLYQRIFLVPKWFKEPPASFELIRAQTERMRSFWVILSTLCIVVLGTALYLNWDWQEGRTHLLGGLICFTLTGILGVAYFIKEIMYFSKIPASASLTPSLLKRIRLWLRWSPVRDFLLIFAALFVSIAYNHS